MASHHDFSFRAGVALVAAFALGVAGVSLYSPGADISDRAFAGLMLGIALLSTAYAFRTIWRGLTNRRTTGDRRQGPTERRQGDRRDRFA